MAKPEEIVTWIPELLALRKQNGIKDRPIFIWEPFPAFCRAESLEETLNACKLVDMFSPNHLEMSQLFTSERANQFDAKKLEFYAQEFLDHSIGQNGQGCVVIRAAEHGCLSASRVEGLIWSPAFYAPGTDTSPVVDPTGAGNAFMGGFALGLQQRQNLTDAAAYGNVAASYALEQIGVPKLQLDGADEMWNGVKVKERLATYKARSERKQMDG